MAEATAQVNPASPVAIPPSPRGATRHNGPARGDFPVTLSLSAILASIAADAAPPAEAPPLRALWFDARGDWNRAHKCVDELADPDSMWVHAYLHRKEGDAWNAGYWYRRAGRPPHGGELSQEWREIASALIEKGST
jgi:hypothetical protein